MATKKETKKTTKPAKIEISEEQTFTPEIPETTPMLTTIKPRKTNKVGITLLIIILIAALLYAFRSMFIVATVNGKPILRTEFNHELEKQAGKQSMNELVTKTLIFQEAEKKGIKVSQQDIDSEIKKIESQLSKTGQKLDKALEERGLTRNDLLDQIRIKKIVDQLVGKNITVSDKEVNEYLEKNKESLPEAERENPSQATKDSIKQQLQSQKISEKFQTWLEELQKNAKINYFIKI